MMAVHPIFPLPLGVFGVKEWRAAVNVARRRVRATLKLCSQEAPAS